MRRDIVNAWLAACDPATPVEELRRLVVLHPNPEVARVAENNPAWVRQERTEAWAALVELHRANGWAPPRE